MRNTLLVLGFLSLASLQVATAAPGDELNCKQVTAITSTPAANWDKLGTVINEHLGFITENMKNGNLLIGGPFLGDNDLPTGGLLIASSADFAAVTKMMSKEPFAVNKVVTYALRRFQMCQLAPGN